MNDVLVEFAERMNSAIVQRIVIVINRGLIMGGKTPHIFKAASREVDQVNRLERQRETNMYVYTIVILMCFFIFLAIIVILNRTIFMSFFDLQNQQVQRLGNFMMISPVDPTVLKYTLFSFVFVQSIGAGVLAGFMMDGKLASGIRYSCILGLISFFTVGDPEVRAWTIRKGTVARKAAGAIHSDMERGFIRAEVIDFEDFSNFGSTHAAKEAGKYRVEGKEYMVRDGDVILVRFNI